MAQRSTGTPARSRPPPDQRPPAPRLRRARRPHSTDARRLERLGYLERTSFPGDGRDYYRIARDLGASTLEVRLGRLREVRFAGAPRAAMTPEAAGGLDEA